jgi:hypothetical protein
MGLFRLMRKHKLLTGFIAFATLCLAGTTASNAASGSASATVTIVNSNIAVVIGEGFTEGTPVTVTVNAGTALAPLSATPTGGKFVTNTFLPDGYSGPVSIIAKQGTISATATTNATDTGMSSPAVSPPVDTSAGAAATDDPTADTGDVTQQGGAAATPAPAAGAGATAADPSGNGTMAATAAWGTPVDEHHFANGLDGFNPYDNGDKVDYGLRRAANCSASGGVLILKGETDGHTCGGSFEFSQEYGRWEARSKATTDKECWRPVHLLWPDNGGGEIDYSESGGSMKDINFFLHYPDGGGQDQEGVEVDQTQWHNYAVEWAADHVTGYVDGKQFFHQTEPSHIPNSPFHETFQLDSQGQGDLCDGNTEWQVDWLRVYKP